MRFSIIIPVYNAEQYIEKAVESVLGQTFQDYEVVLVDDGSVDSSGKICDDYMKRHIKKIQVLHQKNQGQLLTRCNGVQSARGEYCIFLDADDLLIPEALQTLNDVFVQYDNPDMIIYSFYYNRLSGEKVCSVPLFAEDIMFCGETQKRTLYEKFFTSTGLNNVWTKAVKRTVFEKTLPDYTSYAHLRCSEDRLYSMGMVANADRIVYINKPLYEYMLWPNSISRTFTIDTVERFNVKVLYKEELAYLKQWNLPLPEWKLRLDASYFLQTWYVLDKYYNQIHDRVARKQILAYKWCGFIPDELLENYARNPYLNEQQKQCWKWIMEKRFLCLKKYFWKKNIYTKLKYCKRKLLGKRK